MRRGNERQVVISTEETNQEILHLRQEILRLKEASFGGQATKGNPVNIFANHTREPKISLPKKFDGTRSKFRGFVQQVKLFLRLHPSRNPHGITQVGFVGTLLSCNALSWFAPLIEKTSPLLSNLDAFLEALTAPF